MFKSRTGIITSTTSEIELAKRTSKAEQHRSLNTTPWDLKSGKREDYGSWEESWCRFRPVFGWLRCRIHYQRRGSKRSIEAIAGQFFSDDNNNNFGIITNKISGWEFLLSTCHKSRSQSQSSVWDGSRETIFWRLSWATRHPSAHPYTGLSPSTLLYPFCIIRSSLSIFYSSENVRRLARVPLAIFNLHTSIAASR